MKLSKQLIGIISCLLYVHSVLPLFAQTEYRAGFSKQSLEPGQSPFSLPLAGYGFPREGRFSLEWIKKGDIKADAITGNRKAIFGVMEGKLKMTKVDGDMRWSVIGQADQIHAIAAYNSKLYAIGKNGGLLQALIRKKLKWKKIAEMQHARGIAVLDEVMYVTQQDGTIMYADLKTSTLNWQALPGYPGLKSITAFDHGLYILTANDDLMKLDLNQKDRAWIKIARYNNLSFDVRLTSIFINNGKLFGLDKNGALFESRHLSSGNLSVSALALSSGKTRTVIVGVDVCGLDHSFITTVKKEIARRYSIPPGAILINSSHTHFGPVAQHWPTWPQFMQQTDSIYMNTVLRPAIIHSIGTAVDNLQPAELFFGRSKTNIGKNRSLTGGDSPYDNDVDVLRIVNKRNHQQTLLFLTGCHPVFKNEGIEGVTLDANFPAVTRQVLEQTAGITHALFLQGCGGDINPVDQSHKKTGEQLALDVSEVLNKPMKKLEGEISFFMDSVNFPVNKWSQEQLNAFRKENMNDNKDVYAEKNVRWADLMLRLDKANKVATSMPVYIQTMNIGSWKLVGLSREAVTDYSLGIKKLWPGKLVSVAGYCNDVSSYLPTSSHIKASTYEGVDSFFWYGQPALFPVDVYEQIIARIAAKNY